jgi:hypothetical protein
MNGNETPVGQRFVALFIDWDNLAISTSAELGGAAPDLPKVVQKAREFGTIVMAKAYAEWSVTSDRLNVYRAGIEPVYAPTFRFEPDPNAPGVRSKSLADPCMVTDCIETLHLLPMVTDFVLVTGDKDLIPVVRLVQLRGKRVTVIGPDLVANVLREMSDIFIPYRSLVSDAETPAAPSRERNGRTERTSGEPIADARRTSRNQPRLPEPTRVAPELPKTDEAPKSPEVARTIEPINRTDPSRGPEAPSISRPTPRDRIETGSRPFVHRPPTPVPPAPVLAPPSPAPVSQVAPPSPPIKEDVAIPEPILPMAAPIEVIQPPVLELTAPSLMASDVNDVFAAVVALLKERASEGKNRLRATAIRDGLVKQYPNFNESQYGFPRFKDMLDAMQKAGLISVFRIGPVPWASLPRRSDASSNGQKTATAAPPLPAAPVVPSTERLEELIRFMRELRSRSRWLTHAYLVDNLTTYLSQDIPAAAAANVARDVLSDMVQRGIVVVDTEPQDVDVDGKKHRIRLCHLVTSHPLVEKVEKEDAAGASGAPIQTSLDTGEPIAAARPLPVSAVITELTISMPTATPEVEETTPVAVTAPEVLLVDTEAPGEVTTPEETDLPVEPPVRQRVSRGGSRRTRRPVVSEGEPSIEVAAPAADIPAVLSEPAREAVVDATTFESSAENQGDSAPADQTPVPPTSLDIPGAFQAVTQIVRNNITEDRPRLLAPGLKQRMMRTLGHFDERELGFARFGDFLQAAVQAGHLVIEKAGSVIWVSLPPDAPAK